MLVTFTTHLCGHPLMLEECWNGLQHSAFFIDVDEASETYGQQIQHCPVCEESLACQDFRQQAPEALLVTLEEALQEAASLTRSSRSRFASSPARTSAQTEYFARLRRTIQHHTGWSDQEWERQLEAARRRFRQNPRSSPRMPGPAV